MVDLKREFDSLINADGNYVLYIRNNETQQCSCVINTAKSANENCPICLGSGYINRVERIKTRQVGPGSSQNVFFSGFTGGEVFSTQKRFYFKKESLPKRDDLIITCEWNGSNPIVDDYTEIYKIDYVEPLRGDRGEIVYFYALTNSTPIQKTLKLFNVVNNNYFATVR